MDCGDNFEVKDLWRVTGGSGWHLWQLAALEACRDASACHGDEVSVARFNRKIEALKLAGPKRVAR